MVLIYCLFLSEKPPKGIIMKNTLFQISSSLLLILVFSSFNLYSQIATDDRGFIVEVGDKVSDLKLPLISGETLSLGSLKGKVVVLQFTASWCVVCRQEMPHLEKEVWQANKDKDFILIGVDIDEEVDKVAPFIEKMQVTYPMALDPNKEIFYQFAAPKAGVTRNIVIDQSGEIVFMTRLFDVDEFESMKLKIEQLLK